VNSKTLRYTVCSFFLIVCFLSKAQNFSFTEFEREKDSVKRVEQAGASWSYYIRNNLDSLRIVGLEIMNLDSAVFFGLGSRNLGSYQIRGGNIDRGVELLEQAREFFSRKKSFTLLSETENELGNAYFLVGNYRQSADFYLASMIHGSRSSDNTASYSGMIGFGKTIYSIGDTARALLFVQKYLERSLRDDKFEAAADACGFLGMAAGHKGRVELMSAYYKRGMTYSSMSSSTANQANALTNKAITYFYKNKVDSSIYLFKESLKLREEVGATRPIVESFYNLAIFYIETDSLAIAKKYAERGEAISAEKGIRSWQLDCLRLLLEIAEKSGDLTNVESIKFDIERIEKELKEMSSVNSEIIDLAVDFTSLHDYPIRRSYFWEIFSGFVILLNALLLIYAYKPNSTSAGTRA